jgi:hypothetical protein
MPLIQIILYFWRDLFWKWSHMPEFRVCRFIKHQEFLDQSTGAVQQ